MPVMLRTAKPERRKCPGGRAAPLLLPVLFLFTSFTEIEFTCYKTHPCKVDTPGHGSPRMAQRAHQPILEHLRDPPRETLYPPALRSATRPREPRVCFPSPLLSRFTEEKTEAQSQRTPSLGRAPNLGSLQSQGPRPVASLTNNRGKQLRCRAPRSHEGGSGHIFTQVEFLKQK